MFFERYGMLKKIYIYILFKKMIYIRLYIVYECKRICIHFLLDKVNNQKRRWKWTICGKTKRLHFNQNHVPTFHATLWVAFLIWIFSMFWNSPSQASRRWPKTRTCLVSGLGMLFQLDHLWTTGSTFSSHAASESGSDIWWHPHHLGQHQTHHFRQHPEITHSSHFGRSLWATRISSLWATRKTSFLSSHYLIQPFRVWLGGWGGTKRHWCWEQGWDPWT